MTETVGAMYETEIKKLMKVMEQLEQSSLSEKRKLEQEIRKNEDLTKENRDLISKIEKLRTSGAQNTSSPEEINNLKMRLDLVSAELENANIKQGLITEELDKTIEKLNQKVADNHNLCIRLADLKQKNEALSARAHAGGLSQFDEHLVSDLNQRLNQQEELLLRAQQSEYEAQNKILKLQEQLTKKEETSKTFGTDFSGLFVNYQEKIKRLQDELAKLQQKNKSLDVNVSKGAFDDYSQNSSLPKEDLSQIFANAQHFAQKIVTQAQTQADQLLTQATTDAEHLEEEKEEIYQELGKMAQENQKLIERLKKQKNFSKLEKEH